MKNSRKIKKFLISILTATLSLIMLVTQAGALDVITYRATFAEEEEILRAYEYMTWAYREDWNYLTVGVDLDCYEHNDVENVHATLNVFVSYYLSETDTVYSDHEYKYTNVTLTPEDSLDSDELLINIYNFERGYEIVEIEAEITYDINYYNGETERYVYLHNAYLNNGETLTWNRDLTAHVLIYPVDNED